MHASLYFFTSPSQVAILLFLIHLSLSDKEPVKNLSRFVLEPVPRSLRPSFHPRGHSDTLHSASLKIKHIKSSNGCFPSPPPSFHWGWHFSHLTHHYIQPLYSCPSEEEAEEGGGRGYSYRSHLHFLSLHCLSFPAFSLCVALQLESDDTRPVCVCVSDTLYRADKGMSSRMIFAFTSVSFMRFHTARLSLPAVVRWKSECMIITVSVWSSSYFVLYSTIAFFSSLSLAYIYYLNIPYFLINICLIKNNETKWR